jgi:hypothetical protein
VLGDLHSWVHLSHRAAAEIHFEATVRTLWLFFGLKGVFLAANPHTEQLKGFQAGNCSCPKLFLTWIHHLWHMGSRNLAELLRQCHNKTLVLAHMDTEMEAVKLRRQEDLGANAKVLVINLQFPLVNSALVTSAFSFIQRLCGGQTTQKHWIHQ